MSENVPTPPVPYTLVLPLPSPSPLLLPVRIPYAVIKNPSVIVRSAMKCEELAMLARCSMLDARCLTRRD
jgi:hypothetical protein